MPKQYQQKEKVDVSALYCQTKASLAINPTTGEPASLIFTLEAVSQPLMATLEEVPLWRELLVSVS